MNGININFVNDGSQSSLTFEKKKCVYSYILSKEYNFYGKKIMKYYLFIFIKIQKVG